MKSARTPAIRLRISVLPLSDSRSPGPPRVSRRSPQASHPSPFRTSGRSERPGASCECFVQLPRPSLHRTPKNLELDRLLSAVEDDLHVGPGRLEAHRNDLLAVGAGRRYERRCLDERACSGRSLKNVDREWGSGEGKEKDPRVALDLSDLE